VLHLPPAPASEQNRAPPFSFISINRRANLRTSYQVVIEPIGATTTNSGLKVYARLDTSTFQTKLRVSQAEIKAVSLAGETFHSVCSSFTHESRQ
jgi:hypothetical protein